LNDLYLSNLKEKKMKSCLVIAYIDKEADIVKNIFRLKGRRSIQNIQNNLENQNMGDIGKNVNIIKSNRAGVGKSMQIKIKIKKSKRENIYFPIGGVFTRKDVLKRLKKIKNLEKGTLHLDLYDTEQTDLMMEFLFSILITKIYGQNEDVFYLPSDIPIMVEIPNGFVNYMKKFPILDIFDVDVLKIENLAPLNSEYNYENIQLVANYLYLLKNDKNTLINKDLFFKGISRPEFEGKKK